MLIDGSPRRAAVCGSPVAHSLSPVLHHAAYDALGLDGWRYGRLAVGGEGEPDLATTLAGLGQEWVGLSVTMPGKEDALRLADAAAERALLVGAANTLVRRDEGWYADSTDALGLVRALAETGVPTPDEILVLGSGATARSVVAAAVELGVPRLAFGIRAQAREETLTLAGRLGLATRTLPLSQFASYARDFGWVISTLPTGTDLGLDDEDAGGRAPGEGALLMDVVYGGWPTPLGRWAAAGGATVVSGLPMLLHQAAEQVRLMTGCEPPVEAMRAALERATADA